MLVLQLYILLQRVSFFCAIFWICSFIVEEINPCGGEKHSKKTLIEAEAVSPEAYVKENGRFPVLESMCNESGDVVIVTGDNKGSFVRYTFTE